MRHASFACSRGSETLGKDLVQGYLYLLSCSLGDVEGWTFLNLGGSMKWSFWLVLMMGYTQKCACCILLKAYSRCVLDCVWKQEAGRQQ